MIDWWGMGMSSLPLAPRLPVTGALGFKGEFSGIMERFYRTVQKNLPKIALFYCFSRHKSIIFAAEEGTLYEQTSIIYHLRM
jgi:hypothetical protein